MIGVIRCDCGREHAGPWRVARDVLGWIKHQTRNMCPDCQAVIIVPAIADAALRRYISGPRKTGHPHRGRVRL